MPLFCRHNRPTANCPICSRELEAELRSKAPKKARKSSSTGTSKRRTTTSGRPSASAQSTKPRRRTSGVVTKRVARAADDGYRNPLIPGVKATIEAQYLALTIVDASKRLEYPGPHPAVAEQDDRSQAVWLAFLLALVGPENSELQDKISRGA